MYYFALPLLLGLLVIPVITDFPPGSCDGYTNVTEPWRNKGFNSASFSGFPKDDTQLLNKWWRFTGIGGDRVADGCVPLNHGGTWRTIKIPLPYPTTDSVTPTTVNAYGYHFVCGGITFPVSIALCPGGFYVYKPNGHPLNPMGYVTYHYECKPESCGPLAKCTSDGGCICDNGYEIPPKHLPTPDSFGCVDIDECQRTAGICGPNSNCSNTPGTYMCICWNGFSAADPTLPPGEPNQCEDTDECLDNICGAHGTCLNNIGSYVCNCNEGFHIVSDAIPVCQDVDECSETPGICGNLTVCTNVPGTFYCSCPDGFFPSTGVIWEMGISFCKSYEDILGEIKPRKGQTKERAFLENMEAYLKNNTGVYLPEVTVANIFAVSMEMSGVGQGAKTSKVSSDGDGKIGSLILDLSEHLVVAMTPPTENQTKKEVHTSTVDLSLLAIGARSHDNRSTSLSAKGHIMKINLKALARSNNGTASAAFMTLNGMESLLSHRYFKTKNRTEMYSDVFTAIIPAINTTNLMEPVNFTIQHRKEVPETGMITCVYWEDDGEKTEGRQGGETMRWSEEGCWVTYSHENYTICSCSHLSTFALILQIGEPSPQDDFLEWLNRICVIVGLFFFGLAILTFLLCSWNPKINNTARLHLCLNLALSHLLLLWNDKYTEHKLACTIMAGLLHFLIVSGFVWMLLEAVQLHLLVLRLSKVKIIQRDGLPRPLLYLIGYGVPFVIVGVSALIYSDGYGATEANVCWLSQKRNFKWALTGPVITVLAINGILFSATLWNLRPTLTNIKSDISQSKDTKLILFKILAQFVILGCTWILGLYQTNVFFQVIFIIFNSQQGTFLYIVHCVLNKEVREEYMKWLTCSFNKTREGGSVKDVPSISEDLDNPREQTD